VAALRLLARKDRVRFTARLCNGKVYSRCKLTRQDPIGPVTLDVLRKKAEGAKDPEADKQKADKQKEDEQKEDKQKGDEAIQIGVDYFPSDQPPKKGSAVFSFITTSASCDHPESSGGPYDIIGAQCITTDSRGRLFNLLDVSEVSMMMAGFPSAIKALPYTRIKVDFAILERSGELAERYAHLGLPEGLFFGLMCFSPVPGEGEVDQSPLLRAESQGHISLMPYQENEHNVSWPARSIHANQQVHHIISTTALHACG
jgi:hypothetical protein